MCGCGGRRGAGRSLAVDGVNQSFELTSRTVLLLTGVLEDQRKFVLLTGVDFGSRVTVVISDTSVAKSCYVNPSVGGVT